MKLAKTYILVVALAVLAMVDAGAKKPVKNGNVYLFGFSASFADSLVYITDVQSISGVELEKKSKFLPSRSAYSYQLKEYVEGDLKFNHSTCMVFFSPDKSKLEKKYSKIRKKYNSDKSVTVNFIGLDQFKFTKVNDLDDAGLEENN